VGGNAQTNLYKRLRQLGLDVDLLRDRGVDVLVKFLEVIDRLRRSLSESISSESELVVHLLSGCGCTKLIDSGMKVRELSPSEGLCKRGGQ